jgi:hypothetical protein
MRIWEEEKDVKEGGAVRGSHRPFLLGRGGKEGSLLSWALSPVRWYFSSKQEACQLGKALFSSKI